MQVRDCVLTLLVTLAWTAPARAANDRKSGEVTGLVLEVYEDGRPSEAAEMLAPVLAELSARGFAAGPGESTALIEQRASRRGLVSEVPADGLRDQIQGGYQKFLHGDFAAAVGELGAAVETIQANPAMIALDQTMQPLYQRALIGLTLSQRRMGREAEAEATMGELVRTFPSAELSTREYGPEPVELYRSVLAAIRGQGAGRMVVEVDDTAAVIFVNESFRAVARLDATMPAGRYRVYVQKGREVGRVHDVDVTAGRTTRLVIDSTFDAAIRTGAKWTGLVLGGDAEGGTRAIEYAARLGEVTAVSHVVLLGLRKRGGDLEMVGTVVSPSGRRVVRQASLAVAGAPDASRAALGRFLGGDDPSQELRVSVQTDAARRRVVRSRGGRGSTWKWVAATGAVTTAAAGVVLLRLDGTCRGGEPPTGGQCPRLWNTAGIGWGTLGVAGALASTAGYLFWRDARKEPAVTVVPTGDGASVWATFDF